MRFLYLYNTPFYPLGLFRSSRRESTSKNTSSKEGLNSRGLARRACLPAGRLPPRTPKCHDYFLEKDQETISKKQKITFTGVFLFLLQGQGVRVLGAPYLPCPQLGCISLLLVVRLRSAVAVLLGDHLARVVPVKEHGLLRVDGLGFFTRTVRTGFTRVDVEHTDERAITVVVPVEPEHDGHVVGRGCQRDSPKHTIRVCPPVRLERSDPGALRQRSGRSSRRPADRLTNVDGNPVGLTVVVVTSVDHVVDLIFQFLHDDRVFEDLAWHAPVNERSSQPFPTEAFVVHEIETACVNEKRKGLIHAKELSGHGVLLCSCGCWLGFVLMFAQ